MGRVNKLQDLGRRERQILEVIFRRKEASVSDVLKDLPDPPTYDSVRTMIRLLESKGLVRHRREGTKYIYRPTQSHESASQSALAHLMKTFFQGSAADTVAAILDVSSNDLSDEELDRLEQLIVESFSVACNFQRTWNKWHLGCVGKIAPAVDATFFGTL